MYYSFLIVLVAILGLVVVLLEHKTRTKSATPHDSRKVAYIHIDIYLHTHTYISISTYQYIYSSSVVVVVVILYHKIRTKSATPHDSRKVAFWMLRSP